MVDQNAVQSYVVKLKRVFTSIYRFSDTLSVLIKHPFTVYLTLFNFILSLRIMYYKYNSNSL